MVRTIRHWLVHRLGWNEGTVVTWPAGDALFVGFECYGCGKVQGIHAAPKHLWQI